MAEEFKMSDGFLDINKIQDIKAKVIAGEVIGLSKAKLDLRELCEVIPMPKLLGTRYIATSLSANENVKVLEEADIDSHDYTKVDFDLAYKGKNVVHVAIPDESEMQADFSVIRLHTQDAAAALAKVENKQIIEALNDATHSVTGSSWSGANDPSDDIMQAIAEISDSDQLFSPDTLLMHPLVWAKLSSNEEIKKYIARDTVAKTGKLPQVCGLNVVSHPAMAYFTTNTYTDTAIVLDSKAPALCLGDGPVKVKKYYNNTKFYTGIAVAKWIQPKLLLDDAVRYITGVS